MATDLHFLNSKLGIVRLMLRYSQTRGCRLRKRLVLSRVDLIYTTLYLY
jgi:hypothetical protein